MKRILLILFAALLLPLASLEARDHKRGDYDEDHDIEEREDLDDDYEDEDEDYDEDERMYSKKEILTHMKKHLPVRYEELEMILEEDEDEYEERLMEHEEMMNWFEELKEEDPKRAQAMLKAEQLEDQSWMLAEKIGEIKDGKEREETKNKLRGVLAQIFQLRLLEREVEAKQLAEEIEELKGLIERRRKNAKRIIERQLSHMLEMEEDEDELGWW